jgi:predicted Zn-dependent protease
MIVMQGLGHLSGGNAVSELGQIITVMGVGRHYENEADRLGMRFAAKAGFDPRGMLAAMHMLSRVSQSNPGLVGHLLATHPPIPERIAHIKAELKTMGK